MGDFEPFQVIKMADPVRYENLKWIARWNGSLCLPAGVGGMIAGLVGLLEGSLPIWEFLFLEIFTGVMLFYILRLWRWGWRKE